MPYYDRDPKRDHNFDNHPYTVNIGSKQGIIYCQRKQDCEYIAQMLKDSACKLVLVHASSAVTCHSSAEGGKVCLNFD